MWMKGKNHPEFMMAKKPRYGTIVHHEFLRASKVRSLLFISMFGCVLFV